MRRQGNYLRTVGRFGRAGTRSTASSFMIMGVCLADITKLSTLSCSGACIGGLSLPRLHGAPIAATRGRWCIVHDRARRSARMHSRPRVMSR